MSFPVITSFTASPTSGAAPLTVSFTDTSSNSPVITAWSWNFGDGSPLVTTQNPTHVFSAAGTYSVVLTVTRGGSGTTTSSATTITATAPAVVNYILTEAMNGTRRRLNTANTIPINIIVGKTSESWTEGAVIEVLCLSSTAVFTFVADTGVTMNAFNGTTLSSGQYGRVTRNPDGSWDLHVYSLSYGDTNTNAATTSFLQAGSNVTITPTAGKLVIAATASGGNTSFAASVFGQAAGNFSTNLFNSWQAPQIASSSLDISSANSAGTNTYTFNTAGTYSVRITATAAAAAGWPSSGGQVHYGTKLSLPGMSFGGYFDHSQYTRTGPQMIGPSSGDYGDGNTQAWTDVFTVTVTAGQTMTVALFAAAYGASDSINYAHNIAITRL